MLDGEDFDEHPAWYRPVVAGVLSDITREIDELVRAALANSAA